MTSTKSLWPQVILLGDSITEYSFGSVGGWGAMLAQSLQRRGDVIPRGFGGYNSRQYQSVCQYLPVESLRADVAVLFLGANDACTNPQQFCPEDEYRTNLTNIVDYMKTSCGVSEVVMMTPPPCDTTAMNAEMAAERSEELTAAYADVCKQAAEDVNVTCIDLHTLFLAQTDWQTLLIDGLHLSPTGAALLHSALLPVIQPLMVSLGPQNMEATDQILPYFTDAENVNPCPDIEAWVQDHPMPGTTVKKPNSTTVKKPNSTTVKQPNN